MTITVYACHKGGFQGSQATVQTFGQKATAAIPGGTGAQALGGVVPALGDPLAYSLVSGRTALLKAGRYVLPSSNPDYGVYPLIVPADQNPQHAEADSSSARIDRVVAIVKNTGTFADDYADFRIIEGTPGAGVPALPTGLSAGNVHELWQVTMPAGGPSTALTGFLDKRKWLPIGEVTIPGAGATPALAAHLPPNTRVWDPIAGKGYIRDGGSGLVRDIPAGLVRDHGKYYGTVATIPPDATYDAVDGSWTYDATESYSPSATITGTVINLGGNRIYNVRVKLTFPALADPWTSLDGVYCRIERATDHFMLTGRVVDGRIREGNTPVVTMELPNIYSNVDSSLKVTITPRRAVGAPAIGPVSSVAWVTAVANL